MYIDSSLISIYSASASWSTEEPTGTPVNTCGVESPARAHNFIYSKTTKANVQYGFDTEERAAGLRIVALGLLAEAEKLSPVPCDFGTESSSSYSSSSSSSSTSESELSQAEYDKLCREKFGSDYSYDAAENICVKPDFDKQSTLLVAKSVSGSATISEPGKTTISFTSGMKIPNDATISTTTGLVMIEFGESNMQIAPDTKLTISEKVELIWGKIKNSHKALEKCNYDFDVRGDRTAAWHGGKHEFVCVLKTSNGSFAVTGTEYILQHDKQTQITTLHLYEGVVEFKPTNSDNITVVNAGTTATIENGKISTKTLHQSTWNSLNDEFKVPGYQLFHDGVRLGYEPTWDETEALKNFRWNFDKYPMKVITAKFNGQPLLYGTVSTSGYHLFWDGVRMGHEPTWDETEGIKNFLWNFETYPEKVVTAEFNGQPLHYGAVSTPEERVPGWIKNNAKWWAEGQIGDSDFTGGIQHLIKEKIIDIPDLPEQASGTAKENVPEWIKNNAGWWADGQISEDDFVNGIKWLVENGIIRV